MPKFGSKKPKMGRRKRATMRRAEREREESERPAPVDRRAEEAARQAEERKKRNIEALVNRGLLGAGIHNSVSGVVSKRKSWGVDGDKGDGSAYQQLLAKLPKTGAFKAMLQTQKAVARGREGLDDDDDDDNDDEYDDEDGDEDDEDEDGLESDTGKEVIRVRSRKNSSKRNADIDDEEDSEGDDDIDDDEDDIDEEDEDADSDETDDEAGNVAGKKRKRTEAAVLSDDDADVDDQATVDDDSAVSVDGAAGVSHGDLFLQRYMQSEANKNDILKRVDASYEDVEACETTFKPAAFGAGWDTAELLTFTCPEAAHMDDTLADIASRAEHSGDRLNPRSYDLIAEGHVKAKVAQAWSQSYGKETHNVYLEHLKSVARSAKRQRLEVDSESTLLAKESALQHPFTPLQQSLWPSLNGYMDVYFGTWTHSNARELRTATALHILNHVIKARDLVTKHEAKMREAAAKARADKINKAVAGVGAKATLAESVEYRDQGFTRPRVLVLLPFKQSALRYVRSLMRLLPDRQIMNRNRFFMEFTDETSGLGADHEDDDADLAELNVEDDPDAAAAVAKEKYERLQRSLARREKEMLSDVEDIDDGPGTGAQESAADATGSKRIYSYNRHRQGWSKNMLATYKASKASGERDETSEEESEGSDDELSVADGSNLPFSALGTLAGRKKFDDRIIPDEHKFAADRHGKKKSKRKPKKSKQKQQKLPAAIPKDHTMTFAGNIDDDFKLGISVGKKTVKLYADFYDADVIVASPLGLRRIVGGEGDKKRDFDFLSSVEIVVVDQARSCLMQNWDHMEDIFGLLNGVPKKTDYTDFGRVREWNLDGLSKHFRQTICFSAYPDVMLNRLMRKHCRNMSGCTAVRATYAGTITRVVPTVRQVFHRLTADSVAQVDDARFSYFKEHILPELEAGISAEAGRVLGHTLIYVPSYFDYVRLRNLLDSKELEFVTCSEYSEDADIARARSKFFTGQTPVLLMTERYHYFRRLRIRGIRHILFYSPPSIHWFYDEFLNLLEEAAAAKEPISTTLLFTKYDSLQLERLIGTDRTKHVLSDTTKHTFFFV